MEDRLAVISLLFTSTQKFSANVFNQNKLRIKLKLINYQLGKRKINKIKQGLYLHLRLIEHVFALFT